MKKKKRVTAYLLNGKFVESFDDIYEAAYFFTTRPGLIRSALKGEMCMHQRKQWKMSTSERDIAPINPWKQRKNDAGLSRKIKQYDSSMTFIAEYPSVSEAARVVKTAQPNLVKSAKSDLTKTAGGFYWKYSSPLHQNYVKRKSGRKRV
jgi:hypothetical protein